MRLFVLALVLVALAGCAGPAPTTRPTPTPDAGLISRATYAGEWPFLAEEGRLNCIMSGGRPIVTFAPGNGIEYALNGAAIDLGFPELDDTILKDYPDKTGVLPLIDKALADC